MRTLKFNTVGQTLRKNPDCDFSDLVSGTEGYLNAEFDFSSEWFGCKKLLYLQALLEVIIQYQ